jgi:3-methyl-2-oxobutanoate hydroxymethyltransferase
MTKTVTDLSAMKLRGEKISMVTCYDSTFASILNSTAVDAILVGDSLGNTMLGFDNTLTVTLDDMIRHASAVVRANTTQFIVVDMPFMSYSVSVEEAVRNAGKLIQGSGAQAVKLEGGAQYADVIAAIVRAQIPVVGHIGLTPQSVNVFGGFKVQAKSQSEQDKLLEDAKAVESAGASLIVLEGVPREIAKRIAECLTVPIIGIGAGPDVDGQVLVMQDLLGMNERVPKFVKKFANLGEHIKTAFNEYSAEVKATNFPADEHSFHADTGSARK